MKISFAETSDSLLSTYQQINCMLSILISSMIESTQTVLKGVYQHTSRPAVLVRDMKSRKSTGCFVYPQKASITHAQLCTFNSESSTAPSFRLY